MIAMLLLLMTACSNPDASDTSSVKEITEKLAKFNDVIPIYVPKSGSSYGDVVPGFYYSNDGSTTFLRTVFFPNGQGGQTTRIAKMITSILMPTLDDAMTGSRKVKVSWANQSNASTCAFTSGTVFRDSLPGSPYQTCLVWQSGKYWFLFYSVLPLDETLLLVNSLEEVK